jgi:hypothetical protein
MSWNTPYVLWCESRNAGKSFEAAVLMGLKSILYEDQDIYIVSNVGSQAQECFSKIEDIALDRINSIKSLKDIFRNEVVQSPSCKTGFSHNPVSFHVGTYNNSEIFTLNGNPDHNRSKRSSLVFFDEAGYSSEELLEAMAAFATQDSDFATSVKINFDVKASRRNVPTQLIYASSASSVDTTFFRKYKDFAMKMIIGDRNYFCCDIPCTIPINPIMDGVKHPPLLQKSKVDSAMTSNRDKALREYYNKFDSDGGEAQIYKRAMITRNSIFSLPKFHNETNKEKFAIAFDPARAGDGSIVSVMQILKDDNIGYYGKIVNCTNMIDLASKRKIKMKTPDQIKFLKQTILDYNGENPDYENIEAFLIDAGAGGAGVSAYADNLLDDWFDEKGNKHKGFIDKVSDIYETEVYNYPNAWEKLALISPNKYRNKMCEELLELLQLDLIKFPYEYSGKGFITLSSDDGSERNLKKYNLSFEEELALINIDIMKTETVNIHRVSNAEKTSVRYILPKDKERIMYDDKFYTLLLLAHYLYEKRRGDIIVKNDSDYDFVFSYS